MKQPISPISLELSLPSELGYEVVARDAVAALAHRLNFGRARVEDLKTALCEACTNAIEHGNQLQADLQIHVRCVYADQRLTISVRDAGVSRFRTPPRSPSITEKLFGFGTRRGMGLMLIHELADEAGFVEGANGGNCFVLVFYHPSA